MEWDRLNAAYWNERWGSRFKLVMLDLAGKLQKDPEEFKRFVLQERKKNYSKPSLRTPKAGEFASASRPASGALPAGSNRVEGQASASSACAGER